MPRTVIEPEKAKQGRSGRRVLVILVCGLALALIVWLGVEIFGGAIAPEEPIGSAPVDELAPPPPQPPAEPPSGQQPAGE